MYLSVLKSLSKWQIDKNIEINKLRKKYKVRDTITIPCNPCKYIDSLAQDCSKY